MANFYADMYHGLIDHSEEILNGLDVVNEKLNDEMMEKDMSAFWTP